MKEGRSKEGLETQREALREEFREKLKTNEVNRASVVEAWIMLAKLTEVEYGLGRANRFDSKSVAELVRGITKGKLLVGRGPVAAHKILARIYSFSQGGSWVMSAMTAGEQARIRSFMEAMGTVGWRTGDIDERFPLTIIVTAEEWLEMELNELILLTKVCDDRDWVDAENIRKQWPEKLGEGNLGGAVASLARSNKLLVVRDREKVMYDVAPETRAYVQAKCGSLRGMIVRRMYDR